MRITVKFDRQDLVKKASVIHSTILSQGEPGSPGRFILDASDPEAQIAAAMPGYVPYLQMITIDDDILIIRLHSNHIVLEYDGARCSLWHQGNAVSEVIRLLFFCNDYADYDLLQSGVVFKYESSHEDRPWFVVGL